MTPLHIVASFLSQKRQVLQAKQKSDLILVLNDFLRDVIYPAIGTLAGLSECWQGRASSALFIAIRQMQWLHLMLGEDESKEGLLEEAESTMLNLSFALKLLTQPYALGLLPVENTDIRNPNRGAHDGRRREITFRLSSAIVPSDEQNDRSMVSFGDLAPSQRILRWKCVAWELLRLTAPASLKQTVWFVRLPILDDNARIRDYTSRELGKMLLGNNAYGLFSLFARSEDDLNHVVVGPGGFGDFDESHEGFSADLDLQKQLRTRDVLNRIVASLFLEFDSLIGEYCERPVDDNGMTPAQFEEEQKLCRSRRFSAITVFASFCYFADIETAWGKGIMEHSLLRLARLLSYEEQVQCGLRASGRFAVNLATQTATHGELARVARCCNLEKLLTQHDCFAIFVARLVTGVLLPSVGLLSTSREDDNIESITAAVREQRYSRLFAIFRAIVGASNQRVAATSAAAINSFLGHVTPLVIAEFVLAKDYDSLRLYGGFTLYAQGIQRDEERGHKKRSESTNVGATCVAQERLIGNAGAKSRAVGVDFSTERLETETGRLVSSPRVLDRMVPFLFMKADKEAIVFLKNKALLGQISLRNLILSRDQAILKQLVLNIGNDPCMIGSALRAIQTAALARSQVDANVESDAATERKAQKGPDELVSAWVTSHFLYLIVNVIQMG